LGLIAVSGFGDESLNAVDQLLDQLFPDFHDFTKDTQFLPETHVQSHH
jgi:hypothetical protein